MVDLRWMRIAAAVEAISLKLLIVNLLTAHLPAVTSVIGPIHGGAWLATIAIAFLIPLPLVPRWTSLVPGIGGLIALRLTTHPHHDRGARR